MTNQVKSSQFYEDSYKAVMADITMLEFDGSFIPCTFMLNGEHAFPLLMNSHGQILIAASLFGQGRIIAVGHEEFLKTFPVLLEKALTWLQGESNENTSVGFHISREQLTNNLDNSKFQVSIMEAFKANSEVGVYVTDAYSVEEQSRELVAFLKSGGGILIEGQGYSWEQENPDRSVIFEFPGNKVSGVAGIFFTGEYGIVENLPVFPEMPSFWTSITVGKDFKNELDFLLKGIMGFDIQGTILASTALVHGSLAFPIGVTAEGRVFLAGTYYGLGRVIIATHEALLITKTPSSFWKNAVDWLDQGRTGLIGFNPEISLLENIVLKCKHTAFRPDLSVYICKAYKDENVEEIQNFVAEGGGLIIAGNSWRFAQNHPELNPLQDFPGNKILNIMGLTFLKDYIKAGFYMCADSGQISRFHFRRLLQRLKEQENEPLTEQEEEQLKKACKRFLGINEQKSFYFTQVVFYLSNVLMEFGMPKVSEKNPIKTTNERVLLSLASQVFNVSPNKEALLSHLIRDPLTFQLIHNQRVKITTKTGEKDEWLSTGLYLPPGLKINLIMPSTLVNKGWKIQIGCQTDVLDQKTLKRPPTVYERYYVNSQVMEVWNLWGGLLYFVSPPNATLKDEEVVVQSAVLAPYYKSGVTADEWISLRDTPAPWAEFEFDNIILTVPSHFIRDMNHPEQVEKLWNDIMIGVRDLAAIPQTLFRKERLVADVQLPGGGCHAGYPIVIHTSQIPELFHPENARSQGLWALTHELGHNQQKDCWEFKPNTTDGTCNLWSVYVNEEVLGVDRAKAQPALELSERCHRAEKYILAGKSLDNWNLWTCLETYLQLQEKFGWEAFKKVFAVYHKIKVFPKDNHEKMNLFAETFSKVVEMNLTDFFKAWGWPIEMTTEEHLSTLPSWIGHPMADYINSTSTLVD